MAKVFLNDHSEEDYGYLLFKIDMLSTSVSVIRGLLYINPHRTSKIFT